MKIFNILILILLLPFPVFADSWYVDNTATGANDGTSWTDAWESFADIDWGGHPDGVEGGDTIYISGGITSQTYNETLTIGASGSAGNWITISTGQDANYNGTVIIDGQDTRDYCITASSKSYINITGLVGSSVKMKLQNAVSMGMDILYSCYNWNIGYLEIYHNGSNSNNHGINAQLTFSTNPNFEIHHCQIHENYADAIHLTINDSGEGTQFGTFRIHDNVLYDVRDDGIESAWSVDIYDNEIGPRIYSGGLGHPDGVQLYNSYTKVYNNYFHNFNIESDPDNSNSNIFYDPFAADVTLTPEYFYCYNNLILEPEPGGQDAVHRGLAIKFAEPGITSVDHILIANNTVYGIPYYAQQLTMASLGTSDVSDIRIENNIYIDIGEWNPVFMVLETGDGSITYGSEGDSVDVIVDHNAVYASSGDYTTDVQYNETIYSWANYRSASGCDDNGYNGDPDLDENYVPNVGSYMIDHGVTLSSYYTTDKDGTSRPQGSAWDMGSYEASLSACDLDEDGNTDEDDALFLRDVINGLEVCPDDCDINGDGEGPNAGDIQFLERVIHSDITCPLD